MVRSAWEFDTSLRSDSAVVTHGEIQMHSATKPSFQSNEVVLYARLARGLRAVAASVIVGAIVIAALDVTSQPADSAPRDGIERSNSIDVPRVGPAPDAGPVPFSGQEARAAEH